MRTQEISNNHRIIAITGSEGYLARQLIEKLKADPRVNKIYGFDIRPTSDQEDEKYEYICRDITDHSFPSLLGGKNIDTIIHTAWWFNPTHNIKAQKKLDLEGTTNVIAAMVKYDIPNLVYLGSTTAYGAIPENPSEEPFLREEDWKHNQEKRLAEKYIYGQDKAIVDQQIQTYETQLEKHNFFWIRGAIVLGARTNNIVSYVAKSPFTFGKFMFRVAGYDPKMQFVSEEDITNVLYRACMEKWKGVVNVAGKGTVRYSEVIKILGRKEIVLPAWLLYPVTELLWKLRIFKFPSSLLRLIQNHWVSSTEKLEEQYEYEILHSSKEALEQFAQSMK